MTGDHRVIRRAGALVGLAMGDAAGWPSRIHRSYLLPPWTRRLRCELDSFAEAEDVTTLPVPFALNQPTAPLRLGPSDDAEWVAWTVSWLLELGTDATRADVHGVWRAAVADERLPRGRIAVMTAADSLAKGIHPPATGHDNPHHFDDSAAVRAVAVGVATPDPARAAELAEWDAEVTNAGDGVAAARAVATAVSSAVAGAPTEVVIGSALDELPADTALGRNARHQVEIATNASSPMEAVALLDDALDVVYSYGVAAAETVPVALALTSTAARSGATPGAAIAAAACLPRLADSAPALTGALVGAVAGLDALLAAWISRVRTLDGCCAPDLAGLDLVELADRISGRDLHSTNRQRGDHR